MRIKTQRVDYRLISPDALASYMRFRGESTRSLGEKVGCSHGTIHNYASGKIKLVPEGRAKVLCRVLGVPLEVLFVPEVSTVTRDVPPKAKGGMTVSRKVA